MAKNSMYLYGKNSVSERLDADPKSIKNIYLRENFKDRHIIGMVKSLSIPCRRVREKELRRIKRADRLQGIVAEVERFKYAEFGRLLDTKGKKPTLVFLDNVMDPHNLGTIIRTTSCLGNFAVVIPRHSSCEVNDTVMHVASGGENYAPVSIVSNILNAISRAKQKGYWIAGTVVENGADLQTSGLPSPLAIVLGSEGRGIKPAIEKHLDLKLTLRMDGASLSLNVAMAAAVFCYEINRQNTLS